VRRYGIELPDGACRLLESGAGETVKPGDDRLARVTTHLIATPQLALKAAAKVAALEGVTPVLLGDSIEGEARDVGKVMAGIALQTLNHRQPLPPPCVLLSGGETTVTVRGRGRDGVDGMEEIAGAFAAPDTLARAWAQGIRPRDRLDDNDGHGFFEALGDSLVTGPTLTNVNDFRAILIT
jgi:hydroxypyruvate reductase